MTRNTMPNKTNASKVGPLGLAFRATLTFALLALAGGCDSDAPLVDAADSGAEDTGHATADDIEFNGANQLGGCTGFNHNLAFGFFNLQFNSGDPYASNVSTELSNGGTMTVDTVDNSATGTRDILLTRLDANGNLVSSRTYGTSSWDEWGNSVTASHDGQHVVVTGRYREEPYIMKVRLSDGAVIWTQTYRKQDLGSPFRLSRGLLVRRISDGTGLTDYLVAGTTFNSLTDEDHTIILRVDESGSLVWGHRYGPSSNDAVTDVPIALRDEDGGGLWLATNHQDWTATGDPRSFALMPVDASDGTTSPGGPMNVYLQPDGSEVHYGDMLVRADDSFVAVYEKLNRVTSDAALLFIKKNLHPNGQHLYYNLAGLEFFRALAVYETANGFAINTNNWESGFADVENALLNIDASGAPVSWYEYGDFGAAPSDFSPMAVLSGAHLLLKMQQNDLLQLTKVASNGAGCCQVAALIIHETEEVTRVTEPYTTYGWETSVQPTFTPDPQVPMLNACN